MKLIHLMQAYNFEEIMPVVNDMFPGTSKYREPLKKAYDILVKMKPVDSKKAIRYKVMHDEAGNQNYMGAEDSCFTSTWEVSLGKEVSREKGVDLSDVELAANCLVNLCFLGKYPKEFEEARKQLMR
ncbi:hypothetical protein [Prevotella sp. kh1p2]|uniref:hypothetical protein n=1 Tax=Prevotella sp. kh1p2 TaxID=1761883 RepID=UPI000B872077|nr:hypothetical protein [Prevotella sp. kh1p2]